MAPATPVPGPRLPQEFMILLRGGAKQGRSVAAALQNDAAPDPMAINQTAPEEPH